METYEQALDRLRALLAEDRLGGSRLPPERVLANELGVGRRSLRRALGVLESEGRIARRQGRGTFATPERADGGVRVEAILERTNPIEVLEARLALEPVTARLAALRASRWDIDRLRQLAEETRSAREAPRYVEADALFHRAIAEASRNALFLALMDTFIASRKEAAWERLGENGQCFKRQAVHAESHIAIAGAIAARDGEAAAAAMYAHLSDVQRHVYQHLFPPKLGEG
jgi:DNA-binding FadR family transcriptional regulator